MARLEKKKNLSMGARFKETLADSNEESRDLAKRSSEATEEAVTGFLLNWWSIPLGFLAILLALVFYTSMSPGIEKTNILKEGQIANQAKMDETIGLLSKSGSEALIKEKYRTDREFIKELAGKVEANQKAMASLTNVNSTSEDKYNELYDELSSYFVALPNTHGIWLRNKDWNISLKSAYAFTTDESPVVFIMTNNKGDNMGMIFGSYVPGAKRFKLDRVIYTVDGLEDSKLAGVAAD